MNRPLESRGFTLIEMMVAMAILSVVITSALAIVVGVNGSSTRVRKIGDAQVAARQGLDELALEIRGAGSGAASGEIGVAPGTSGAVARRVPVIYSGPNVTITEPGGQAVVTNSIFIIGGDASSVTVPSDNSGMQGVVVSASNGQPLTIICSDVTGAATDCANGLLKAPLPALLVGDMRDAAYVTPTALAAPAADSTFNPAVVTTQKLTYNAAAANAYAPSPKAPFGFLPGAILTRARVTHWYLKQAAAGQPPQLVRSFPVLTSNAMSVACSSGDAPFIDETNDPAGPAGTVMSTAPIESLQIRYILDSAGTNNPTQFTSTSLISVCDVTVPSTIREVRLQVVSRTSQPDYNSNSTAYRVSYSTPGFEGASPMVVAGGSTTDAYPRRAFTTAVVPRSLQGVRL